MANEIPENTNKEAVANEEDSVKDSERLKSILRNGVQIVVVDESKRESPQKIVSSDLIGENEQIQLVNG